MKTSWDWLSASGRNYRAQPLHRIDCARRKDGEARKPVAALVLVRGPSNGIDHNADSDGVRVPFEALPPLCANLSTDSTTLRILRVRLCGGSLHAATARRLRFSGWVLVQSIDAAAPPRKSGRRVD